MDSDRAIYKYFDKAVRTFNQSRGLWNKTHPHITSMKNIPVLAKPTTTVFPFACGRVYLSNQTMDMIKPCHNVVTLTKFKYIEPTEPEDQWVDLYNFLLCIISNVLHNITGTIYYAGGNKLQEIIIELFPFSLLVTKNGDHDTRNLITPEIIIVSSDVDSRQYISSTAITICFVDSPEKSENYFYFDNSDSSPYSFDKNIAAVGSLLYSAVVKSNVKKNESVSSSSSC